MDSEGDPSAEGLVRDRQVGGFKPLSRNGYDRDGAERR